MVTTSESTDRKPPSTITVLRTPSSDSMATSPSTRTPSSGAWPGRMPSSPEMERARTNFASPSQTLRSAATISTLSELTFPPDRGGVRASLVPLQGCSVREVPGTFRMFREHHSPSVSIPEPLPADMHMSTAVSDALLAPTHRPAAVEALTGVIDAEVADKSGLGGAAVKAGYAAAKKLGGDFVASATDRLLPQFASALDPFWATKGDQSFGAYLA